MKKHLRKLPLILAAGIIGFIIWWGYNAEVSETGLSIQIPHWCAGTSNVSYSIMIHRSQINRYGTIWRAERSGNMMTAFPVWPRSPFADLFKLKESQQKPQSQSLSTGKVDEL